jgi:hypothetical protein
MLKKEYDAPRLRVVGLVSRLTADDPQDKKFGPTDGFTFMGVAITNAS